jgi:WD40 repeat protein/serine/threonine protein kinase/tetratricopeptide (TPR) repeat protein
MDPSSSGKYDQLDRLAEEFAERCRRGERPSPEEYAARHPDLGDDIRDLFPALVEVEQAGADRTGPPSPDTQAAPPPREVGDFRILRRIGQGGMGAVYEAEQVSLGRRVALKVLSPEAVSDNRARERFRREARAAARLHHTNIVPVFEVGQDGNVCYYAMQLIQGRGLDQVIREVRRLRQASGAGPDALRGGAVSQATQSLPGGCPGPAAPTAEPGSEPGTERSTLTDIGAGPRLYFRSVARLGQQAALALAHAHARGIIHRDVKPSNLLLDESGILWVADFGLAKTDDDNLTRTGDLPGTLRYMAPERFAGRCDARADVYALGLTLYELLVLVPAFTALDRLQLLEQIRHREPPRPRALDPRVPRDLETVVLKASDKDPRRRYQSADELAEDLRRFLADEPVRARRVRLPERLGRWCRRNPAVAGLTVLVAVTLLAGTCVAAFFAVRANNNALQAQANEAKALGKKAEADRARAEADDARRESQDNLFAAEMSLAGQTAESPGSLGRVGELLGHWRPRGDEPDRRGWEWYYLRGLGPPAARWLHRANGRLCWSPDGRYLAAVSRFDETVQVWDATTGRPSVTLRGHALAPFCLSWSPDGTRLASCGYDGSARLWDVATGRQLMLRPCNGRRVMAVCWGPDGRRVATLSLDGTMVQVWDAETGRQVLGFSPRTGNPQAMSWGPRAPYLAVGEEGGTITLWDANTGREGPSLPGHTTWVQTLDWSPDGRRLASGSQDQTVRLWDVEKRAGVLLRGHAGIVWQVQWSPDGSQLASAGDDGSVKVWDTREGRAQFSLDGHAGGAGSVAWSPDGRLATSDGVGVRLWDTAEAQRAGVLSGHTGVVSAIAWSPDGRRLASASHDYTVRVWDAVAGRPSFVLHGHRHHVRSLSWSPDGRQLASGDQEGGIRLWDPDSGRPLDVLPAGPTYSLAWGPHGRLAAGGWYRDVNVQVWDTNTRKVLRSYAGYVNGLSWGPDGRRLAGAGADGVVRLWDPDTDAEPILLRGHTSGVSAVSWDPTGRLLASADGDQTLKVWEVSTGRELASFRGHNSRIGALDWSPDGHRLFSGSTDGTAKVWDVATGKELLSRRGHAGRVEYLALSPDGLRLASGGGDGTVRIWDALPGYREERSPVLLPELDRRLSEEPPRPADLRFRAEIHARRGAWEQAAADWDRAAALPRGAADPWFEAGWWVAGPFPESATALPRTGTEPDPLRPAGASAFWQPAAPGADGCLDFAALFPQARVGSACALVRVYSPREQEAAALIATGGGGRCWLNGRLLTEGGLRPAGEEDALPVTFRPGWNSLLVQINLGTPAQHLSLTLSADPAERARALVAAGRWDEAEAVLTRALDQHPDEPRVLLPVSRFFRQRLERAREQGEGDAADRAERRARACLEKLITLRPHHAGYAAELADLLLSRQDPWEVLVPAEVASANGSTLKKQSDGSVLAGGKNPPTDTYTVTARTSLTSIRAVRLELLTDASLPASGPGRAANGNFHLSEFRVSAAPAGSPDAARPVVLRDALADFSQVGFPVTAAVDGNLATSWGVYPEMNLSHTAIFEVQDPITTAGGAVLTFTLDQQQKNESGIPLNVGRFRLAVLARPLSPREERWRAVLGLHQMGAWTRLGAAHYLRGDWQAALTALHEATAGPDGGDCRDCLLLALVHGELGEADAADKWADEAFARMAKTGSDETFLALAAERGAGWLARAPRPDSADSRIGRARVYLARAQPDKALAEATRAVELRPQSPAAWRIRADIYLGRREWDKALAEFSRLVEVEPGDWELLRMRADLNARCGKWAEAAADFDKLVEPAAPAEPLPSHPWYRRALARLAAEDATAYRRACALMAERFKDADDWEMAFFTPWACVLGPDALSDLAPALRLAERARAKDPDKPQSHQVVGAVLYRMGRLEESLRHFRAAEDSDKWNELSSPAYCYFFHAMALHRLGQRDEARQRLARAVEVAEKELADDAHGGPPELWIRPATLRLLRAEAEAVFRAPAAGPQK